MKLIKSFIQGIMNKDLDERLIPNGQYRDALNIEVNASEGAGVGAIENIKGNTNVTSQAFSANAKTIGAIADDARSNIYWFVADDDFDYVMRYHETTGVTTILLKDSKGRVLNFDKRYLITGVNIIDNLLFWTDNLNPPRRLNVDRVYTVPDGFIEDDISVIVKPPVNTPLITLQNSTVQFQENNLKYKFLQFACRYKYENDEYSAISPFSSTAFAPSPYLYVIGNDSFSSMSNSYNQVSVDYFINGVSSGGSWVPDARIKEVQLLFRDTASTNINIIESFDINDIASTLSSNGYFTNTFDNSKIYTVLPPDEITRLFDNVPLKAQAQELIGSRIAYGNYVQFYDIVDNNGTPIDIDYTLDIVSTPITSLPLPTFRSDRDYEVGIVYMDDYSRMTTVLVSDDNTASIDPTFSDVANDIRININNEAPAFATKYRMFIKQAKGDYYNIFTLFYYQDGIYTWFQIDPSEVDKVPIGEYIILKTEAGAATKNNKQYKVLDVQSQPKDFLDNGGNQNKGLYFKLKVEDPSFFDGDDITKYFNVTEGVNKLLSNPKTAPYITDTNYNNPGTGGSFVYNYPIYYGSSVTHNVINPLQQIQPDPDKDYRLKITITGFNTSTNKNRYRVDSLDVTQSGGGYYLLQEEKDINILLGEEILYPLTTTTSLVIYHFLFQYDIGYKIGDYWIVNIHSNRGRNLGDTRTGIDSGGSYGSYGQFGPKHYAIPQGSTFNIDESTGNILTSHPQTGYTTQDRIIRAGARITININDINKLDEDKSLFSENEYISPRDYANIEEWFWESGAYKTFKHTGWGEGATVNVNESTSYKSTRVFFRRGFGREDVSVSGCTETNRIAQTDGTATAPGGVSWSEYLRGKQTFMIIKGSGWSSNGSNCDNQSIIRVSLRVDQQEQSNVFETTPLENDADIYYELSDTFDIINGEHKGNEANQSLSSNTPAIVSLNSSTSATPDENSMYNAYCFGNGVEGLRIRGDFNAPTLKYSPRVSSVIEEYKQQRVEEAITYSGIYRENTGINNLNEFNLSLANFKYIDKFFGSIQKLHARDTDLITFQENKVSKILYGKNLLSDSVGGGVVASIPEVLGTQVTFSGEYGISQNPESFATWGNSMYFTDSNRGAVMRLGNNGMFEISSQGMRDYFKDLFKDKGDTQKIGAIDPYKERYVLADNDELVVPCDFSFNIFPRDFNIGNAQNTSTVTITSTSTWTIDLIDTGDGTSWVTINGLAVTSYSGQGNEVVDLTFDANLTHAVRTLGINFTGCSTVYPHTATQFSSPKLVRDIMVVGNDVDSGLDTDQEYSFGVTTIDVPGTKLNDEKLAFNNKYEGFEGVDSVPEDGDSIILKSGVSGTSSLKPFNPNFGNKFRYYVTDTEYTEENIDDLLLVATEIAAPVIVGGNYEGTFTFTRASKKYLYLIYDYRNNISPGDTLTGSVAITGDVTSIVNYSGKIGNIDFTVTPGVTNNFIIKWNGRVVAESGTIAAPTTLSFLKNEYEPGNVEVIVEGGGAFTVGTAASTLTSFDIDLTDDDITTVCAATTSPDTRLHTGSGALPAVGDVVYLTTLVDDPPYNGNNAFHRMGPAPTTDYAFINESGVVLIVGSCTSCAEVAVPVITQPNITLTTGDAIDLTIPVTNNPITWDVITTCNTYQLNGGDDGALFTTTDCTTGDTVNSTVFRNSFSEICTTTAPVVVSGTGTSSLIGTCDDHVMPPGISLDKLNGVLSGTANAPGTYTFTVTATNCFGTSINTDITIVVNPVTNNRRFNMDQANPEGTSGDACTIVSPYAAYSIFYHNGQKDYPEVNDIVSEFCDCQLRPFNGGYLWYVTDELTGGKNNVIRIDSTGMVVEKVVCP